MTSDGSTKRAAVGARRDKSAGALAAAQSAGDADSRAARALTRNDRIERAFFRGAGLTLENPAYAAAVGQLLEPLLEQDLAGGDLTASALGLGGKEPDRAARRDGQATVVRLRSPQGTAPTTVAASVVAREDGVIAGLAEFTLLYEERGVVVELETEDGEAVSAGETVLGIQADRATMLALERTGLNLLQRMSGVATAARRMQNAVRHRGSLARIVGTRKTPWGLLDKRALHLGGVGTHRLGLGDAILIKNNHLALIGKSEEEAAPKAIEKAWALRESAAFIEVEVRGEAAARAAAETFRRLQESSGEECPCVLMLDNMRPGHICRIIKALQDRELWDAVLVEASGGVSESNVGEYADCGADVISVGALTHSARALDLSQRIS